MSTDAAPGMDPAGAGGAGGAQEAPPTLVNERALFGPSQGVRQLFAAAWTLIAQYGWYGVVIAVVAYAIWLNMEDKVRAAAKKLTDGPPVKADPEKVQAARARQLALHQQKIEEERERRKAEMVAEALGTEKPAPRPNKPEPRRFLSSDDVNPLLGGGGGGSCSYRPGRRGGGG